MKYVLSRYSEVFQHCIREGMLPVALYAHPDSAMSTEVPNNYACACSVLLDSPVLLLICVSRANSYKRIVRQQQRCEICPSVLLYVFWLRILALMWR